ncbi:hypothetical protein O6H91_19G079200 [Diphasiastrum complanatum]|uniref:Uncharacterized protein n=1 Tax=Diphasiastrum complanatum TaxID=34168 RepID=A0ACC2AWQ1_DIPCM|nr:hypothetical protein O6H91_19G079200 [Diphasiastrum complanatum]
MLPRAAAFLFPPSPSPSPSPIAPYSSSSSSCGSLRANAPAFAIADASSLLNLNRSKVHNGQNSVVSFVVGAVRCGKADLALEVAMAPRKMSLQGTLFKYGPQSVQVAFRTGDFKKQVIMLGGLTDGFFATEYVEPLAIALEAEKWSVVQPLLSSSYAGYGTSSLKQDCVELEQLISYLINEEDSQGVILVGHSTGCQDIVHFMRAGGSCSRAVRCAILQGPVSDREYRALLPDTASMIDLAESMIREGKGLDLMPREANPDAPITAYRYRSLSAYMGDDDMFSSDLTDEQLRVRLGHMSRIPCQVIFSMSDEYVPEYVNKPILVQRLCDAMGGAEKVTIAWGNHGLSNRVQEAVKAMVEFIRREWPKGWDDPWR